jgi:cobalt-precorrin 5A hydrolase
MHAPTAIWIVRESARPIAERIAKELNALVLPAAIANENAPSSNRNQFESLFHQYDPWILLMATGIATRFLSGLPKHKLSDPAVVVLDEAVRFAIPILGGHEKGANALAYQIALITGATPVITTATEALKPLTLGIGCRRGMSAERIHSAVTRSLQACGQTLEAVREVATVDIKSTEPGLLQWIKANQLPLRVFSSDQLAQRPWTANPSNWVQKSVGLAGVCEPCALLAAPRGNLILPKLATAGVTVAIVADIPSRFNIPCADN